MSHEESRQLSYRGFLSYAHRDAKIAAQIHRRLETYRIPRRLIGEATARGPVPRRVAPIFRDREELSAGEDLTAQVRAALDASDCLVVLCSPAAQASPWVAKEIATFRALHPLRPVLAAIVAGEPDAAFPPELLAGGAEPIAADFRSHADGMHMGVLKLAAGMLGVNLNTLVHRDAQRQNRRLMVFALAALGALAVVSALLVTALRAQSEAQKQRHKAEGFVEFMLTDLRDRLNGAGRLDIMGAVNDRASSYYGNQKSLAGLPNDSLDRRARLLHAMGEDDERRGDSASAYAKFLEAHRTTAAILARNPDDPDAIFAHAQSEFWLGESAFQRKDFPTTLVHWQAYRSQAGALATVEPGSPRSLMELGYSEGNLCDLATKFDADLGRTESHCRAAISYERAALLKKPDDQGFKRDLANRYGWLAAYHFDRSNYDVAISERQVEASLMDELLARDPQNLEYTLRRSWADIGMAKAYSATGRPRQALRVLRAARSRSAILFQIAGSDVRVVRTNKTIDDQLKAAVNMLSDPR